MQIALGAVVTGYHKLKDRSFKLSIETGELSGEQLLGLDELTQKSAYVVIGENPIKFEEIKDQVADVIQHDPKEGKLTPSQRLRNIMYRYREQFEKEKHPNFLDYYENLIEKYIKFYQDKLT